MRTYSLLFLIVLTAPLAAQQSLPPVGSIDVYGIQHTADSLVRRAAGIALGDAVPIRDTKAAILARLRAIPGVEDAALSAVCCEASGRTMLFIGIAESGAARAIFRPAPTGSARAGRNAEVLDIARWSDPGHALPGLVILWRIEGRSDQEIFAAIQRGDRKAIIEQAEKMLG